MAVNLEELALKSIEQYAAFGVRLASIESALLEMSRKNELKEEKFIIACDKISRLEERFVNFAEDRILLAKRMDDITQDVNSLANSVRELMIVVNGNHNTFQEHKVDHCEDCHNVDSIKELADELKDIANIVRELNSHPITEVRELATSKWGLLWLRFMISKWGQWWFGFVTVNVAIAIVAHWEIVVWIAEKLKLLL